MHVLPWPILKQWRAGPCTVTQPLMLTSWVTSGTACCAQCLQRGNSVWSCATNPSNGIGCPCAVQSSSMCMWLYRKVMAKRYHLKVGQAQSSCCWGRKVHTYGSEREREEADRHHHHHHDSIHHIIHQHSVAVKSWPQRHLQRALPRSHPFAQAPCVVGRYAHSQRRALGEEQEAGPQDWSTA